MLYGIPGADFLYDMFVKRMVSDVWRRRCAGQAQGRVLEVGIGTGLMLPYYGRGVTEVVGIDRSVDMLKGAARRAERVTFPVFLEQMDVEDLRLEAACFDTVVSAFLFCSVKNPLKGLAECRRVLCRGGRLILMEHVSSRKVWVSTLLKLVNPFSVFFLGDHLTRDTVGLAREAGFRIERIERLYGDVVLLIVGMVAD